jgi:hypothetical protein
MSMKHEKQQSAEPTSKAKGSLNGNYPGLNAISWGIGYLEHTLSVISEPLLLVCAAIAVIDSITGGHLMAIGLINYTWAASLAIAVTACFIVTWRRSLRAFGYNRYGAAIGLAFLGSLLRLVDLAAIAIQALQQTLNISFAQALAMLNLNIVVMTYIRSCVAIAMAVVVAVSNNTAVTAAQAPKRRLAFLEQALNAVAPVVSDETAQPLQKVITRGRACCMGAFQKGVPCDQRIPAVSDNQRTDGPCRAAEVPLCSAHINYLVFRSIPYS